MTSICKWCSAMLDPCGEGSTETCEFCSDYDSQAEALNAQEVAWSTEFGKKFDPDLGCGACEYIETCERDEW